MKPFLVNRYGRQSPDIARGKAFGSVAWKLPSAELGKRFTTPGAASGMVGISSHRLVPHQGALPIWSDGRCAAADCCALFLATAMALLGQVAVDRRPVNSIAYILSW